MTNDLRMFKSSDKVSYKLVLILTRRLDHKSDHVGKGLMRRDADYVPVDIEDNTTSIESHVLC